MPAQQQAVVVVCNFMDDLKINFSAFGVIIITSLTFLSIIVGPIVIFVLCLQAFERGKTAAIYFFFGFLFFYLLILSQAFIFFKAFVAFVQRKPAILLTKDSYIDNIENVKISWSDISSISIYNDLGSSFLKISLNDNSVIYKQANRLISKFRFRNLASNGGILSINTSLLQGSSKDILDLIKNYQKKIAS